MNPAFNQSHAADLVQAAALAAAGQASWNDTVRVLCRIARAASARLELTGAHGPFWRAGGSLPPGPEWQRDYTLGDGATLRVRFVSAHITAETEALLAWVAPLFGAAGRASAGITHPDRPVLQHAQAVAEWHGLPYVLVDGEGTVMLASRRARELLNAHGPLELRGDRLVASGREQQTQLERRIQRTLTDGQPRLGVLHGRQRSTLAYACSAADTSQVPAVARIPMCLLRFTAPAAAPQPYVLQARLGLSPTEAELLAELATGCTLAACAERLGRNHETLRSQVKSIFAKTDTHSQIEVAALASFVAWMPYGPGPAAVAHNAGA